MTTVTGQVAYYSGLAAEKQVAKDYTRRGLPVISERWRGRGGEIDLIARDGEGLVFVEVKKSGSFERAAEQLRPYQIKRICKSASEYLAHAPRGQLTDVRFDLALVDGRGQVQIIENAFGHG
ncbi:MAG: YraN family protein [Paracoccaceae bacterium]